MQLHCYLLALCLVLGATAVLAGPYRLESDVVSVPPEEWNLLGPAHPDAVLPVIFALKLRNTRELEDILLEVSDPSNPTRYGQHLTHGEVEKLVSPHPSSIRAVSSWLESEGFGGRVGTTVSNGFMVANMTVAEAERLLNTRYATYQHDGLDTLTIRAIPGASYDVPDHVAEHLDFVAPTVRFPVLKRRSAHSSRPTPPLTPNNITLWVDPDFLHALYQVPEIDDNVPGNLQAVVSFIQQFYKPSDLDEFQNLFAKANKGRKILKQIGKNDPTNPGLEATLDVQYLTGVATKVDTWVWYNGNELTPFLSWLLEVSNTTDIPHLFSISYGDYENGVSRAYGERVNTELAKLGARGVSVMVASGDSGAGGNCTSSGEFSPDFPATSPWITTVGGLEGGTAGATPTGEIADYISGGGFSTFFPRPAYQDAAVEYYLKNQPKLPASNLYNSSGRAYPDVACQSESFMIVVDGVPLSEVSGTSCATPTFSGVVSLLNNIRIQNGKPPLGFLNPLIYQTAASTINAFNDAVEGTNAGCELFGFSAFKGWDPLTGWGSPNYKILSEVVSKLP